MRNGSASSITGFRRESADVEPQSTLIPSRVQPCWFAWPCGVGFHMAFAALKGLSCHRGVAFTPEGIDLPRPACQLAQFRPILTRAHQ